MWDLLKYVRTGSYHHQHTMDCQDQVHYKKKNGIQAIALADGTGKNCFAAMGAGATAEFLTDFLVKNFEFLYQMPEESLKRTILLEVKHYLFIKSRRWGAEPEELNSTFIAVAIDHRGKRYISAHLGDGVIAIREREERRIFSYPQNGYTRDQTYLTISTSNAKPVRIQRGNLEKMNEILLISDGWRELDKKEEGIETAAYYLQNTQMDPRATDDVSAICLRESF